MKKMENGCAPDALDIYKAFGDLAADTLFWKLIFLNSALFGTPNRQAVKQKLLSQSRAGEALIHTYYTLPAADRLIELADVHNRLFVIYVERSAARRPALRESTHRQWEENGRRIARLLPPAQPLLETARMERHDSPPDSAAHHHRAGHFRGTICCFHHHRPALSTAGRRDGRVYGGGCHRRSLFCIKEQQKPHAWLSPDACGFYLTD